MNTKLLPNSGRTGFTLVELIVAMSVAALMLFMINRIFFDTTRAISRGVALSDTIQSNRAVSQKLEADAEAMVAPGTGGGFLVIMQKRYSNVEVIDPTIKGTATANIRSDQLMFIRTVQATDRPLVPQDGGTYTFETAHGATHARVWYGHLARTDTNGEVPQDGNGLLSDWGLADATDTNNPNLIGTRWILGSQTLFLSTDNALTATHAYWDHTNGRWRYPHHVNSSIPAGVGFQASLPANLAAGRIYAGLTDVTVMKVKVQTAAFTDSAPLVRGGLEALTGSQSPDLLTEANPVLVENPPSAPELFPVDYGDRVYDMIFGTRRLRMNPDMATNRVDSWRIGQMHPYLVPRVSDFIVEFAGDFDAVADGQIDTVPATVTDTDANGRTYTIEAGTIKWYGHYANEPEVVSPDTIFDSLQPLVYSVPTLFIAGNDNTPPVVSPTLPIYDVTNQPALADAAMIFRHDSDPARWPYLLRIRYRMHDQRGEMRSGSGQHGIWFEQILAVNR